MFRHSIRSSKSLALSIALGVVAAAGISGCGESDTPGEEAVVPSDVQSVRVTAADINKLAPGEFFNVDITRSKVVYKFDYSDDKAIDYTRVKLVTGENQSQVLEDQLKIVEAGDYGENPQPNMHTSTLSPWFSVTTDPADFGVLKPSQLDQVKADGFFYEESAASIPQSQPQSTDNCIHAVCVICYNPATGGPADWSTPGGYVCFYEEHVWCD
jgi:hypothetical protein